MHGELVQEPCMCLKDDPRCGRSYGDLAPGWLLRVWINFVADRCVPHQSVTLNVAILKLLRHGSRAAKKHVHAHHYNRKKPRQTRNGVKWSGWRGGQLSTARHKIYRRQTCIIHTSYSLLYKYMGVLRIKYSIWLEQNDTLKCVI